MCVFPLWIIVVSQLATAAATIHTPLFIDCGGDGCRAGGGRVYVADRAYSPHLAHGFVSGDAFDSYPYLAPGGTDTPELHLSERIGSPTYRFDLPPGRYVVTLRLGAMLYHGSGSAAFDVRVGTDCLARDMDLNARGPRCYAQDLRAVVECAGEPLWVQCEPSRGWAEIAAIEICDAPEQFASPKRPKNFEARSCPGGVFLNWGFPAGSWVKQYQVERVSESEGSVLLPRPRNLACFHWDTTASYLQWYRYRVAAVNLDGAVGPFAESEAVAPLPLCGSWLPTFRLQIDSADLRWMLESVHENRWVSATLTSLEGTTYSVRVRIRGGVSRHFQKKSFKIRFRDGETYGGRSTLNLVWKVDPTFVREALGFGMFRKVRVPACNTSFCHLVLNGETQGVYVCIEQIDGEFLEARGFDGQGALYEVEGGDMTLLDGSEDYARCYDRKTGDEEDLSEIIEFVELVNGTPDTEFPQAIWEALDVDGFLDWYAIVVLAANRDVTRGNHYLYLDPQCGRWRIFPWDNDLAFPWYFAQRFPLDMGAEGSEPMVPMGPNRLITRILEVDAFRYLYASKLAQYVDEMLAPVTYEGTVDSLFGLVREDGLRDRLKVTWEDNGAFLEQANRLREFGLLRREYVRENIETLGRPRGGVWINEIHLGRGSEPSWVELWNGSEEVIAAGDLVLSDCPLSGHGSRLQSAEIPPGGYYVVALGSAAPGVDDRVPFEVTKEARCLALRREQGGDSVLLDVVSCPPYVERGTVGRIVDGDIWWVARLAPTPGRANRSPDPSALVEPVWISVFPNPAKRMLTVECLLLTPGFDRLDVLDIQGRCVRTLHKGPWRSVLARAAWDGKTDDGIAVASGRYLIRLSGPSTRTRGVTWIR